jgi:hypothetical protein
MLHLLRYFLWNVGLNNNMTFAGSLYLACGLITVTNEQFGATHLKLCVELDCQPADKFHVRYYLQVNNYKHGDDEKF